MNEEDESLEEAYYIEFVLEGVLKAKGPDKERILAKLNKIFTKVLDKENAIQISSSCNLVSEKSLIASMNHDSYGYDN